MLLKTPMLIAFKKKLASMSKEESNALWNEITKENEDVQGPTAEELITSFRPGQERYIRNASQAGTLGEPLALSILLGVQHREAFLEELDTVPGVLETIQAAIQKVAANGHDLMLNSPVCDKPAYDYDHVRIVSLTAEGAYRVESVDGQPLKRPMLYTEFRPKTLIAVYRELIGRFDTGDVSQAKAYAELTTTF